jgi:thiamine-phosphate pyrophosphorylase
VIVPARIGRLVVITDTQIQSRFSHEQIAELACEGGADVIQLRDKQLDDEDFAEVAARLRDICRRHGAQFFVNDRVGVAHDVGADGVHLGRDDLSVQAARAILGAGAIIGTSAGSQNDARAGESAGADYIGFGHIFPTSSKTKANAPVGLEGLAAACSAVKLPIIAIGGIDAGNASRVMDAGAWGIAVIAAVCAAKDPRAATRALSAVVAPR